MNLSAEKRKMPRMQLDLSGCIFWGIANNRANVNIQNLSIHGISFCSKKYFTEGTQFHLTLPNHKKDSGINKIQAEVVRCETVSGFSSDGRFKIGARFLFKAPRPVESTKNPTTGNPSPLQPIDSQNPQLEIYKGPLKTSPGVLITSEMLSGSSASRIRIREVRAELIESVRTSTKEETVYTSIQIKQARFISSPSLSPSLQTSSEEPRSEIGKNKPFASLARRKFS